MNHDGVWLRRLPNGKAISALGFGCSSVWAKSSFDEARAQDVLESAAEEGVTYFDTSPSYGVGVGESRLGRFLRDRSDVKKLVLSTKVGSNLVDNVVVRGFDRDVIRRSFDESMQRLGLDHVDILYLHGPSLADLNDDVFRFFDDARSAGRITYSGVNSFDHDILAACANSPIDAAMVQYNVADFRLSDAIARLNGQGKIVISGTALARAQFDLTTFFPRDFKSLWYLARMARQDWRFVERGRRLAKVLRSFGPDPYATAIRFVTASEPLLSNLFGSTDPAHVRTNVRAAKEVIDPFMKERLHAALRKISLQ